MIRLRRWRRRYFGITDNAVRFHIATLERTGTVRRNGTVRGKGAGKPAVIYELTESAEELQSRAYAPVLAACVEELAARLPVQGSLALHAGRGRLGSPTISPSWMAIWTTECVSATEVLGSLRRE